MEEIFENPILSDLFEKRFDGMEFIILKENNFDNSKFENELLEIIRKSSISDELKKCFYEKFNNYENSVYDEMYLLNKNFYKIGFVDGIRLAKEAKEIINKLKS